MATNNNNKALNVPHLRFPEFSGEWEEHTLQDVVTFSNGKAHENCVNDDGDYILVNSKFVSTNGQVQKRVTSQLSPLRKSQFVMVMSDLPNGKALAKCFYVEEDNKYTLNQRICSFTSNDGNVSRFLMYQINRNKYYMRFDDGINQTNLKKSEVLSCPVFIPTIREQEKIATLLCKIDDRIATQNKIIEKLETLIKAIGNKCLFGHGRNVRLGDILIERTEKSTINDQYEILSSTIKGIFSQRDYFSKDIASENNIGYKVLHKGDIVLSPQNLWMGNINYNDKFNFGIVSPSYKIFAISEEFDCHYVAFLLKTHRLLYSYRSISEQGASIVRRNLNMDAFLELTFKIPPFVAQRRIGQALSKLNDKIEMERDCLNMLKAQKQYLLSNLFI